MRNQREQQQQSGSSIALLLLQLQLLLLLLLPLLTNTRGFPSFSDNKFSFSWLLLLLLHLSIASCLPLCHTCRILAPHNNLAGSAHCLSAAVPQPQPQLQLQSLPHCNCNCSQVFPSGNFLLLFLVRALLLCVYRVSLSLPHSLFALPANRNKTKVIVK